MNIQQLIYIIEVNKWKSFSIAAKNNYISQSRLSKALSDLEKELGFDIFIRNSKGISSTTVDGMQFLQKANEVVLGFENFKYQYNKKYKRIKICTVNINCVKNAYEQFIQRIVSEGDLSSIIDTGTTFEVSENILKNDYDLGIVVMVDKLKAEWEAYFNKMGLEYVHLKKLKSYFIMKNNDELAHKDVITFDDLVDHTFIQLSHPIGRGLDYFDYVLQTLGASKVKRFVDVYDKNMAYSIVSTNKAFHAEADAFVDHDKFSKLGLICKKPDNEHIYNLGYITKKNKELTKEAELFINILKDNKNK